MKCILIVDLLSPEYPEGKTIFKREVSSFPPISDNEVLKIYDEEETYFVVNKQYELDPDTGDIYMYVNVS